MRCVFILLAPVWITAASAGCPSNGKVLFACLTRAEKQIQLCDQGSRIRYSFGSIATASPEIVVSVPRMNASTTQWNGIGRYVSYSIEVPNEDIVYSVFFGVDRLADDHEIDAGVRVLRGEEPLATIHCAGSDVQNDMEGVDLRPTQR